MCPTCLAICKNARVVTVEGIFDYVQSNRLKNLLLICELRTVRINGVEAVIECKNFGLLASKSKN
jgi:hypothetical protein